MNFSRNRFLALTALACCTVAMAQSSQTAGALKGVVKSKAGKNLSAAAVVVRNLETGFVRTVRSTESGEYTVPLLPTGSYEVTVSAPGMKTIKDNRVVVTLGNTTIVNPTLDVAEASATVEVTAASAAIDTTQTGTVSYVDRKLVEEIPLVTRNFTDMAKLAPGVVSGSGTRLVVEGARQIFNAIQIDGASNNSLFFSEQRGGVYTPFIFGADTIKELQVVQNGFDVQYGQAGATVNAITKNGTNEFGGSALFQMRKTSWSAKPRPVAYDPAGTFNTPINLQRFNDSQNINFNAGGPIVRDKLWYFVGVERFNKKITASPIPTKISAPGSTDGLTQDNFDAMLASALGKVVTSKGGLTLAQEFGNPGRGIGPNTYPMENTNTVYFGRLDYSMTDQHRFVLRTNYQRMTDTLTNTSANPNNADSNNIPTLVTSVSWVLESNNIWTSELFTESRLQLAREARPMRNNAAPGTPAIAIPTVTANMSFGTKTSTPRESNEMTTQFFSATTWNRGDWQIKAGVEYTKGDEDNQFFQNNAGSWRFDTYAGAAAWANGSLGATTPGGVSYNGGVSPLMGRILMWTQMDSLFAQAQYSALLDKRLILTLGLRTFHQAFSNNPVPNPNFAGLDQGYGGRTLDPRLAFTFNPDGKGATVIRGGYGSFTSPTPLLLHSNTMTGNGQIITNYGFTLDKNSAGKLALFNSGLLSASQLISGTSLRKATDAELAQIAGSGLFSSGASATSLWDPDNKLSQSKKANLSVEHDFGQGLVLGVSGTFVHYLNLQRFENINLSQVGGSAYNDGYVPGLDAWSTSNRPNYAIIRGRRVDFNKGSVTPGNPVGGFSDVFLVKSDGWGYYRGLSFSAKKTWDEKTGLIANLTYAKAEDTGSFERGTYTSASSDFSSELGASLVPNVQDPSSNYGYGDSDRRWVMNVVAFFPLYWGVEMSLRGLYQSGLPYAAYLSTDTNGDGMKIHFAPGHTRNDERQPGYYQLDLRFSRAFAIPSTKVGIEAILDVYNLFNKADYFVPTGGYVVGSAAFGQLANVSKDRTREVQLGVRIKF